MLVDVATMRASDRYTIDNGYVSERELMRRAGVALAKHVIGERAIIVCGKGNNGGDGYVAAEALRLQGLKVTVYAASEPNSDSSKYFADLYGGEVKSFIDFLSDDIECDTLIDCIFGTGIKGAPQGIYAEVIEKINALDAYILSCDMPSGLNDSGIASVAVKADKTVAIGAEKTAYYLNDGKDYTGEIITEDIGIKLVGDIYKDSKQLFNECFPKKKQNTHKGSYGKSLIIACSEEYVGAGLLSVCANANMQAEASLRAGAGLSVLCVPDDMLPYLWERATDCSLVKRSGFRNITADAIAYGMGVGRENESILKELLEQEKPLLIDADGINILSKNIRLLENKRCDVVLTPHIKEFSRLSGLSKEEISNDMIGCARRFAVKYRVTLLLKGTGSVITDGAETYINSEGCAGQAKGGSGDVLSGVITALLARGIKPVKAAACGAYIAGRAARIAEERYGEYGMLASDVALAIKDIAKETENVNIAKLS